MNSKRLAIAILGTSSMLATGIMIQTPMVHVGAQAKDKVITRVHRPIHRHRRHHVVAFVPRNTPWIPAPLVSYEVTYVPPRNDPMHLLPRQVWRLFACIRWREGGDLADQPNGAGMYQYTNNSLWWEFGGGHFGSDASAATPLQQDIVAYRTWKVEQLLPWLDDPCVGELYQVYHHGHDWGWY